MSVPQIRIAAIEAIARKILMEYDPALLEGEPCAIPIETIIETKFDLILEYHILRKNGSILGETIFDDGAVILYDQYQHEYRLIGVMSIYGVNTWAMSTYESRRGLMRNYITPIIGDMCLGEITPRMMDKYYRDLLSVKAVSVNNRKPTNEYLTPHTVREIHKLLRNAFNQAVRWELIARNPVLNATLPKEEHKEREIWTADMLAKAMEVCDDPILLLALNLAFSCSLRMGEMLGLTWDCVDVSPHSIDAGNASIFVNKELQRVTRGALDDLSDKGVIKKFPPCIASTHTALVLKEPKTKTSIRRVYLPKTVAKMLVDRKAEIDELKDLFGDEYIDNDLVFCTSNGRPMESQIINRAFNKLIKENGFPHVVFHSLRHSSITYKLKLFFTKA